TFSRLRLSRPGRDTLTLPKDRIRSAGRDRWLDSGTQHRDPKSGPGEASPTRDDNLARRMRNRRRTTRRGRAGREAPDGSGDHLATTGGSGRIGIRGPPDKQELAVRLSGPRTRNQPTKPPGRRPGPTGEAWFKSPRGVA